MSAPDPEPTPPRSSRVGFGFSLLLVAVAVFITCAPALDGPQLSADEFRYFAQLDRADQESGVSAWRAATVIENRWDHLWWLEPRAALRFFRPLVIQSFRLDGGVDAAAPGRMVRTNILLHLLCALLVAVLWFRILGPGLPALLAALLFAAMAGHAETIYYVTGRNATLVALGVLATLICHVEAMRSGRRLLGVAALLAFVFALGSKESALVTPLICLGCDRLGLAAGQGPGRTGASWRRWLYAGYGLVAVGYLALRQLTLGGLPGAEAWAGGELYPYLVLDHRLPLHLLTQLVGYGQTLAWGTPTTPFSTWQGLGISVVGSTVFAALLLLMLLLVARGDRRMRWCLLLGVLAWLPASVVYFSERYAYLPSVAWAGAVALLLARLAPVRHGGWLMVAVAGALIGLQGTRLRQELARKSEPRTTTALAQAVVDALPIPPADRQIQVLHLPADWVHAQFLEAQLRAIYRDAGLSVCVLSPQSFGLARIHTEGDRDLLVEGVGAPLLDRGHADLAWRELRRGARYLGPGFEVEILDGDGVRCSALRYRFDAPRPGATLLQFEPPAQAQQGRARWIRAGRFVVHRLW